MSDSNNYTIDHTPVDIISAPEQKLQLFTDLDIPLTNEQIDTLDKQRIERRAEFEEPEFLSDLDKKEKEEKQQKLSDDLRNTAARMDEIEGVHSWKDEQERIEAYNRKLSRRQAIKVITGATAAFVAADPVDTVKNLFGLQGGVASAQEIAPTLENLEVSDIHKIFFGEEKISTKTEMDVAIYRDERGNLAYEDLWDKSKNNSTFLVPTTEQISTFLSANNITIDEQGIENLWTHFSLTRRQIVENFCAGIQIYNFNPEDLTSISERNTNPLIAYTHFIYNCINKTAIQDSERDNVLKVIDLLANPNKFNATNEEVPINIAPLGEVSLPREYDVGFSTLKADYPNINDITSSLNAIEDSNQDLTNFNTKVYSRLQDVYLSNHGVLIDITTLIRAEAEIGKTDTFHEVNQTLWGNLRTISSNTIISDEWKQFVGTDSFKDTIDFKDPDLNTNERAYAMTFEFLKSATIMFPVYNLVHHSTKVPSGMLTQYKIDVTKPSGKLITLLSEIFLNYNNSGLPASSINITEEQISLFIEAYNTCLNYLKDNPEKDSPQYSLFMGPGHSDSDFDKLITILSEKMLKPVGDIQFTHPIYEQPEFLRPMHEVLLSKYALNFINKYILEPHRADGVGATFTGGDIAMRIPANLDSGWFATTLSPHENNHGTDDKRQLMNLVKGHSSNNMSKMTWLLNHAFHLASNQSILAYDKALGVGDEGADDYGPLSEEIQLLKTRLSIEDEKELLEEVVNLRKQLARDANSLDLSHAEMKAIILLAGAKASNNRHQLLYPGIRHSEIKFIDGRAGTLSVGASPTQISFLDEKSIEKLDLQQRLGIVSHQLWYLQFNKNLDVLSPEDLDYVMNSSTTITEMILTLQKTIQKVHSKDRSTPIKSVQVTDFNELSVDLLASNLIMSFYTGQNGEYREIHNTLNTDTTKFSLLREMYTLLSNPKFTENDITKYFESLGNAIKSGFAADQNKISTLKQDLAINIRMQLLSMLNNYTISGVFPFPDLENEPSANLATLTAIADTYIDRLEAQFA